MAYSIKDRIRLMAVAATRRSLRKRSQPYRPGRGSALVVAPHPDDETLGCGGLIMAKVRAGMRVDVLFLTAGEASHPGHPGLSPGALGGQRRAEAIAALAVLGLGPAHAKFWDLPDSRLDRLSVSDRSAAIGRLADLICSLRPDETFLPYREGGSSEHSAACDLGLRALEQAGIGRGLQYPVWGWWDPRRLHPRLREDGNLRLELDGADRRRKREALACHRSQVEATPPWRSPVLPPVLAAACIGPEEFFFASVADAPQVD